MSAIQGAAQGAQMGSTFGPWGAAIGAVAGFAIGGAAAKKKDKEMAKAIDEQAAFMRRENARTFGELSRQRTMQILNTAGAINYIKRTSGQVKADINVQNAAADAIGASAAAVYSAADAKQDEAEAMVMRELDIAGENLGVALDSQLYQSGLDTRAMIQFYKNQDTSKQDNLEGLLGLAETGGSLWAKGAFKSNGAAINQQGQSKPLYNNPAFVRNM